MGRLASRISETTVTTGTGNLTLAGAQTNRKSFNAEYGLNKRFPYQIEHTDTDWEEGVGYLSATTTLVRETVLRSSNSDSAVNFGAGTKYISVDFVSQMQHGYVTKTSTITAADIAAESGVHHELTISGLTAERNFLLPVPAAIGEQIRVKLITDAHADYELVMKGVATVTINSGTAATEWSRLLIKDEVVEFMATSLTNWDVVNDGRIPCAGKASRAAVQSIPNSHTVVQVDTSVVSIGIIPIVATPWKTKIKRKGLYSISINIGVIGSEINAGINLNTNNDGSLLSKAIVKNSSTITTVNASQLVELSAGDVLAMVAKFDPISNTISSIYGRPWIEIKEILS